MDTMLRLRVLRWGGLALIVAAILYFQVPHWIHLRVIEHAFSQAVLRVLFVGGLAAITLACWGALQIGNSVRPLDRVFGAVFLVFASISILNIVITLIEYQNSAILFGSGYFSLVITRIVPFLVIVLTFALALMRDPRWIKPCAIAFAIWMAGIQIVDLRDEANRRTIEKAKIQQLMPNLTSADIEKHIVAVKHVGYRNYMIAYAVLALAYAFMVRPRLHATVAPVSTRECRIGDDPPGST